MGFLRQVTTLTRKDLLIVAWRSWLTTFLRALILPIAYMTFVGYVRLFFLPPSTYGVGNTIRPIRNLTTEVFGSNTNLGGRNRVVFVNNGFTGGQIDNVITAMATPLSAAGADVRIVSQEQDLLDVCRSSLRGYSRCYASVEFTASPTEGTGQTWAYTARADFSLGITVDVNAGNNDAQVFILPFIHAIDSAIAAEGGLTLPEVIQEYPFTDETLQERENQIQRFYMRALARYLAVILFIGMCGITYHLPGYIASERESGMSQLIDAMLPTSNSWHGLSARLMSAAASFSVIYMLGWIAMGIVVSELIFLRTSTGVVVGFHIMMGLSLTAWSLFGGSFFRRSQLSGVSVLLISLILVIIAQFVPRTSGIILGLSVVFPPVTYQMFVVSVAGYERRLRPASLTTPLPNNAFNFPLYLFFVFAAVQIIMYPLLAALLQRLIFGISVNRNAAKAGLPASTAFRLENVSKTFNPPILKRIFGRRQVVQAVNDLSLDVQTGRVVVLLGANGAGKSTLSGIISGTLSTSNGQVKIDRTRGLGYCPQRNTLWKSLTVYEHVKIFNRLKATGKVDSKHQLNDLITACDLTHKATARSKTLSGGQQRKLQLAMAFTGGSLICCVDEVSSGLDPLSRKIIWDILLAERGRRTLLLTTHALDEADALADEIVVMSKGNLATKGTAAELKQLYGGGYRVETIAQKNGTEGTNPLGRYTQSSNQVAAADDSAEACRIIDELQQGGAVDLQITGPTIEHVFLKLAEEYEEELLHFRSADETSSTEDVREKQHRENDISRGHNTSFVTQVWILFRKRVLILSRNYIPYCVALLIPVLAAGLSIMFLGGYTRLNCTPLSLANNPTQLTLGVLQYYYGLLIPVGPTNRFNVATLPAAYRPFTRYIRQENSFGDFQQFVSTNFRTVNPGGFYLGDNATAAPILAYRINGQLGGPAIAKTVLDSYLMNTVINASFSTFALPLAAGFGDSLQLILYFGFAMCVASAFFTLYPTFERIGKIRNLHYSNGIQPAPLWLAYALFDSIFVILIAVVTIVLFTSLSNVWFAPGYLFVVFFLFGISSTLLSYIVGLFSTTQLAAFAFVAGGQAVFLLVGFIIYMLLITFAQQDVLLKNLTIVQFTYNLITPSGNLLRALLLATNQSQLLCRGQTFVSYPADIDIYGGPILNLTLQIFAFYGFLVWYDSGWRPSVSILSGRRGSKADAEKDVRDSMLSTDVMTEMKEAESSPSELKVLHLNKQYRSVPAVQDVSFHVPHSQVMALLGPNGAGKTTTMSLVRGDIRSATPGDVFIEGNSIRHNRQKARALLGVCPQFDTADRLTVTEHLTFYARVRSVEHIKANVQKVIAAVGLSAFKTRMVGQLSGGNQRKLSLATAVIGNPSVLMLDEPSSGMDAVARRIMWKAIKGIQSQRSVVITTHSMEEATALADKVGIMAKRLLAVGTTDALREKHGRGQNHVHLVLHQDTDMQSVCDWMGRELNAKLDGQMLHGQLRFIISEPQHGNSELPVPGQRDEIPAPRSSNSKILHIMKTIEANKSARGIEFYSVNPTTLEDVFLAIARRSRLDNQIT